MRITLPLGLAVVTLLGSCRTVAADHDCTLDDPATPRVGEQYVFRHFGASEAQDMRGRLVGLSDSWVVVERGSLKVWIPRDRILRITHEVPQRK